VWRVRRRGCIWVCVCAAESSDIRALRNVRGVGRGGVGGDVDILWEKVCVCVFVCLCNGYYLCFSCGFVDDGTSRVRKLPGN
jgi:hypothetical protein